MHRLRILGRTTKGPVRNNNQDHILLGRSIRNDGQVFMQLKSGDDLLTDHGLLLAVADGVGGTAGGAAAGRIGLTEFGREFDQLDDGDLTGDGLRRRLTRAAELANQAVLDEASRNPAVADMGATLTGLCLLSGRCLAFNAGDSRVYRLRGGFLKPLTQDDTVVAQAVRSGLMTPEEALTSDARHTLTNCLGSENFRLTVSREYRIQEGDIHLICSDGLHDLIAHEDLEARLAQGGDLKSMLEDLIATAIDHGGPDNISAIILRAENMDEVTKNFGEMLDQVDQALAEKGKDHGGQE